MANLVLHGIVLSVYQNHMDSFAVLSYPEQLFVSLLTELNEAIGRLLTNRDSPADRRLAQTAHLGGSLLLSDSHRNVVADDTSGLIVTGSHNQIIVRGTPADLQGLQEKLYPPPRGLPPPMASPLFVGREQDIHDITSLLSGAGPMVIVYGWPGVGKTALAGILGRHETILSGFPDGVLWTSLGKSPNVFSSLMAWVRALHAQEMVPVPTLDELTRRLNGLLSQRKMLLIVDDVWDTASVAPFLAVRSENCGLLFTTRETHLIQAFTTKLVRPFRLPVLREEDALRLLWTLAPNVVDEDQQACRLLVRDLEFLPLALHVAGRLLRTEAHLGWGVAELLEDIRSGAAILRAQAPDDRAEGSQIPTVRALLNKSTDLLTPKMREYFAYLGVFAAKPATFDLQEIQTVWQEQDPKPFVRSLVAHGLLEPVANGRFQMHALLVAHAQSLLDGDTE